MCQHNHNHGSAAGTSTKRLFATMTLNLVITAAEAVGGILSGSLSLLSDAMHNFSDAVAVIISYIAIKMREKPNSAEKTFGYKRAELLAAVINASVLLFISVYLVYESIERFIEPQPIDGLVMTLVASVGLAANVAGTLLLRKGAKDNVNIRSAYIHLFSDAVSSVAVIAGGAAIYFFGIYWLDPVLTLLISAYVIKECYGILSEVTHILMESTPANISVSGIKDRIETIDGVADIHHVHVWSVDEHDIHFEAHVNTEKDIKVSESDILRQRIEQILHDSFGINHSAIQFEFHCCSDNNLIKQRL